MSILSIDMGIQNLAFAHLRVSPDTKTKPELTAWRRLSMSEIGSLYLNSEAGGAEAVAVQSEDTLPPKPKAKTKTKTKEDGKAKIGKEKEPFCPSLYASNAYTLLNSLLSSYNPTHILIERQRFRSGGGSAVQEWTIRVGVLEGMLYAVLHTLRQERGSDVSQIQVHGIEPGRVVKYWIDREGGKMSAREVKKAKIGIVGELLERGKIGVPEGAVGDLVGMYLGKVNGKGNGKGKIEVGKLDDLADCLLQGVTWLEWEGMRGRLVKRGLEGLEC
jgi:cruciform cutting endonuclease 1